MYCELKYFIRGEWEFWKLGDPPPEGFRRKHPKFRSNHWDTEHYRWGTKDVIGVPLFVVGDNLRDYREGPVLCDWVYYSIDP